MFRINKKLNEGGNILILILAFGWVSMVVVLGLISFAIAENRASKYKANREEAVQVAEAGIAYYRWHLAHNNNDFMDGTDEPGPYVHEYRNKSGDLIGYYSLTIIPPENGSTIVTLFSTGWLIDQPDSKRTLKIRLGFPAISDYAFLVDGDLIFSSSAFVHGKTHANGRISFNGTSDAPISSSIEITGSGGPKSYWLFPVPEKDLSSVSLKLIEVRNKAQENGLNWPYLPASGAYGYQLTFRADGMVDVSKVVSSPACYSDSCYDATDFGTVTTYEVPSSSHIFIDDTIWVNGVVKGRATVGTIGNDIIINGNLTYLAKDGTNVLGLMTDSNIIFPYNVPDPMEVNAALLTVNGTIFRPKYIDNGANDIISLQNFYGSRISNFSGGMKYLGCGSVCSGFENTNYTYDANLTYRPPAGFPVGSTYNLISWEEVREISTSSVDFIPVSSIEITPSSATVAANTTQQFTATAFPENASVKNITWSVLGGDVNGRITANGLYTAPDSAGTATIIAQSGGVVSVATVTITSNGNSPPTIATSPYATPSAVTGVSTILSALGHDDGGEGNLRYTWSIVSKPVGAANPTFSPNGTNPSKNTAVTFFKAGTYQFQVTVLDNNGLSVVSPLVQVEVTQTLTAVSVTPSPVVMAVDTTQTFAATTTDQFSQPMATSPSFTWSASSGSITTEGVYTPAEVGAWTVTAQASGKSGNATVSVTEPAAPPTVVSQTSLATGNEPTTASFSVSANQIVLVFAGSTKNPGTANTGNFYLTRAATGGTLSCSIVGSIANTQSGAVGIWECIPSANLTGVTVRLRTASFSSNYEFIKAVVLDGASATLGTFNKSYGSGAPSLNVNASSAKSLVFSVGYDTNFPGGSPTFNQNLLNSWVSGGNDEAFIQQTTNPTSNPGNVTFTRSVPGSGAWNMAGVEVKSAGPGSQSPTIATPAAASPSTVNKTTTTLSVMGADDGGEVNLTYTWGVTSKPAGAPDPTYATANNTNGAKNNLVTFYQSGTYQFQVTIRDQSGNAVVSPTVTVTVNQILTTISIAPVDPNLAAGGAPQQFSATSTDQFGLSMHSSPSYLWSATGGSITASGLFTPPGSEGALKVYAVASSVTGTSNVTISLSGGGGPNCTSGECIPICADGIVEPGEQCDDANTIANDGCSPTCTWESLPGVTCTNITSDPPSILSVPITLRDFKGYPETGGHADFERYMCSVASLGLVQTQLSSGKPVFARTTPYPNNGCGAQLTGASQFNQWYNDTVGVNKTVNDSLTLRLINNDPATYEYDSSLSPLGNTTNTTQLGFFPLDLIPTPASWGMTPAGGGLNHNFAFTTELHYWFTYQGGEVLSFSGDDDVWVFINGRLALDLGGLHPRVTGSITLSGSLATNLGLVSGGAYEIALYHAERHTTQSNFKLTLAGFVKATTQCVSQCGDGVKAPSEECDEGANNGAQNGICTIDCKLTGPVN